MIAIVGPTASGKSARALELAERHGGEIVSCDSMQIYRGADIGTAKPSAEERARVPHHLIDVVEPDAPFSAARYSELADAALASIAARGRCAILVGGTGLYLRALRWGLFDAPPRDEELRQRLIAEEERAPGTLHARLAAVDPRSAERLGPRDRLRLIRALEVQALTGVAISTHHERHAPSERHPMRVFVLDPGRAALAAAITARTKVLLERGLIDETRRLRERFPTAAVLGSVGYKEALLHLEGQLGAGELPAAIVRATRHYERRQRTWFRGERDVRFVSHPADIAID